MQLRWHQTLQTNRSWLSTKIASGKSTRTHPGWDCKISKMQRLKWTRFTVKIIWEVHIDSVRAAQDSTKTFHTIITAEFPFTTTFAARSEPHVGKTIMTNACVPLKRFSHKFRCPAPYCSPKITTLIKHWRRISLLQTRMDSERSNSFFNNYSTCTLANTINFEQPNLTHI